MLILIDQLGYGTGSQLYVSVLMRIIWRLEVLLGLGVKADHTREGGGRVDWWSASGEAF